MARAMVSVVLGALLLACQGQSGSQGAPSAAPSVSAVKPMLPPLPPVPEAPTALGSLGTPKDNPSTPAKVRLGNLLFFDVRMSADGSRSCYSCHDNADGTGGHDSLAVG